jgi:hypothetical protein
MSLFVYTGVSTVLIEELTFAYNSLTLYEEREITP